MDKTRDGMRKASRSSPAKRHFDDQPLRTHSTKASDNDNIFATLERSKREKLKKLSSVCEESGRGFVDGEMKKGSEASATPGEEDVVEFAGATKKSKLPRKLLVGDCNAVDKASVPRKLRSAMKKRNHGSLSSTLPDSKKLSHSVRGGESHKKNSVKKFKKERNSGWSARGAVSGSITKDEEEVAEALYALAGTSPNNAINDNISGVDSLKDGCWEATPEVTENSTLLKVAQGELNSDILATGDNEEKSSKEATKTISLSEPNLSGQHVLLGSADHLNGSDRTIEAKLQQTPVGSNSEQTYEKLRSASGLGFTSEFGPAYRFKQPDEIAHSLSLGSRENIYPVASITGNQLEHWDSKNDGTTWSLCASSTMSSEANILLQHRCRPVRMPPWLDAAVCPTKPGSVDTCLSNQKVFQTSVDKRPWKRCAAHVQICHLIRLSQTEESKDSLLQPKQIKQDEHRKREQFAQTTFHGGFSTAGIELDAKRGHDEVRSAILLPMNHIQDRQVACPPSIVTKSKKPAFNFLSLSAGGGGVNPRSTSGSAGRVDMSEARSQLSFPHVDSLTQGHFSMGQNRYSSAYYGQLSAVALQQGQMQMQLPGFLGSSGQPSVLNGPMVSAKEQQHQQLLWAAQVSAQCKPVANSKTMAQYSSWQGGTLGCPTLIPCAQAVLPPSPSTIEVLGPKYSPMPNHLHHQPSYLNLSMPHHGTKRQDHHPHSVYQETTARIYAGGSLPLQLLCNERL